MFTLAKVAATAPVAFSCKQQIGCVGALTTGRLRVWLLLAAVLMGALPSRPAHAICRVGDSIWEISSRALPDCPSLQFDPAFQVHQVTDYRWCPKSLESLRLLLTSQTEQQIVFYVHGNRMPQPEARERALAVYQRMLSCVDSGPICFIAFSWPSEQREGFVQGVQEKKARMDADSYYFARAIQDLQLQQSVGFLGYSFGAAVVCGAQHLLAGGNLDRYRVPPTQPALLPARTSLMAPAFDRQELTASGSYYLAVENNVSMVNLYNSMDPILRRFRFFDRDSAPIAAGFAGLLDPRSLQPLSAHPTIEQFDCRCIGRTHAELDYLKCPHVSRAFENVLMAPSRYVDGVP